MPPSPALRFSPGRELRDNHKRGHSFEGGFLIRDKDDDLALFNEMQTREMDSFLLHPNDDFNDSFSTKLRYFSDIKLGLSVPVRGESSDLLNVDGDKNDYDWLLTPPDTPLFRSLDDETSPVKVSNRGRPRSQPIPISRSTTTENSYRASRSSASPHRLSPSPRSGNSTLQSRGRPSSSRHSSPGPVLRPTTPSRSPSTPPKKASVPAPRSSTPTPRRMSTGSSGIHGTRGTSPVTTSRGNSSSPKLRAWQSNIPGFSSDIPPNLRTSLSDRPASYVRGSSPASRNGRGLSPASSNGRGLSPASRNGKESSPNFGRQSMSPTASRSASSSYSHDRDQFSSHSKGSIASSGDDDRDSLQSVSVSISNQATGRKDGVSPNSRVVAYSKKSARTLSSSAPKRSFDSALRQMDRRSPQKMFRPLLSSVPSTSFYVGKTNFSHHPLISRNSSVTTSSNASSEQGATVAPDTESSEHDQDHMATECEKAPLTDCEDEVFLFDKVDELYEDPGYESHNENPNRELSGNFEATISEVYVDEPGKLECGQSEADYHENMATCFKCSRMFYVLDIFKSHNSICPECSENDGLVITISPIHTGLGLKEMKSFDVLDPEAGVPELQKLTSKSETIYVQDETNDELSSMEEEGGQQHVDQQVANHPGVSSDQSDRDVASQELHHLNSHPSLKVDVSGGKGISVLLKKSSSSKWPVVQSRAFTAMNVNFDDPSYARGSVNSMRSSTGHDSTSASSSVDLTSSRHTEARIHRQLSLNMKPRSRGSSLSGISNHSLVLAKNTNGEAVDISSVNLDYGSLVEILQVSGVKSRGVEFDDSESSFATTAVIEGDKLDQTESFRTVDSSTSESLKCTTSSDPLFPDVDEHVSSAYADKFPDNVSTSDIEEPATTQESSPVEEEAMANRDVCGIDNIENSIHGSSIIVSVEQENVCEDNPGFQADNVVTSTAGIMDEFHELSDAIISEKGVPVSADSSSLGTGNGILEESTVIVEGPRGHDPKSLTLDEATDTILFCSSIIHDLAYQAATIGMEKENLSLLDKSRPTISILGKSSSDKKDPHVRTGGYKRAPKSQKVRQKKVETDVKASPIKTETEEKSHGSIMHASSVSSKVDNAKLPPKLENKCSCVVM
ncbi:hypothetical protein GIB67_009246 [Kingdonia uniflora]|uniref:Uncharacterized protein n=1 Tax=Kingdonia uniflora TaxID=39325 RepID=A0A7J7N2M5_9MAGN|nr:hypothetical protein GIB67_009246 [Kingdonia uniflora]